MDPPIKIYNGFGPYQGFSLSKLLFSQVATLPSSPRPFFQKPSWLPSWASLGVGSYPLQSLITLIPARVPGLNLAWPPLQGVISRGPYRALRIPKHTDKSLIPDLSLGYQPYALTAG